jgi:hypothetical protein
VDQRSANLTQNHLAYCLQQLFFQDPFDNVIYSKLFLTHFMLEFGMLASQSSQSRLSKNLKSQGDRTEGLNEHFAAVNSVIVDRK